MMPAFMITYAVGTTASLSQNFRLSYRDVFCFGYAFRNGYFLSVFGGGWLTDFISPGFAYDHTYSQPSHASAGLHEVVLEFPLAGPDLKPFFLC
jgi:hypothetical protein